MLVGCGGDNKGSSTAPVPFFSFYFDTSLKATSGRNKQRQRLRQKYKPRSPSGPPRARLGGPRETRNTLTLPSPISSDGQGRAWLATWLVSPRCLISNLLLHPMRMQPQQPQDRFQLVQRGPRRRSHALYHYYGYGRRNF